MGDILRDGPLQKGTGGLRKGSDAPLRAMPKHLQNPPVLFYDMKPVSVERIAVKRDRISILVRMGASFPRYVSDGLAQEAARAFPGLTEHACINDCGPRFGDVIAGTSVPHLLEHLIIHGQVFDSATPSNVALVGTTEWLDEANGLARIEVNYADDLVALSALKEALAFLNERMADWQ